MITFVDLKTPRVIREAAILTNLYVAAIVLGDEAISKSNVQLYNQLMLDLTIVKGSLTSIEIKVEFSPDNTNWYQESVEEIDEGIATLRPLVHSIPAADLATSQKIRIPIQINDRYIKISFKGTGTVTDSSVSATAQLGVN